MRNFIHLQIRILFFIIILFSISTCDNHDDIEVSPKSYFSFTYNGKPYNLGEFNIGSGGVLGPEHDWIAGASYIWINRPDIFGGVILYKDVNCTFFSPVNDNLDQLFQCQLTSNGNPVDPIAVYFYKSGSHTFTKEKFSSYKVFDFYTGTYFDQIIYDVNGTFNLELVNSENKIIRITNGKYNFKQGGG